MEKKRQAGECFNRFFKNAVDSLHYSLFKALWCKAILLWNFNVLLQDKLHEMLPSVTWLSRNVSVIVAKKVEPDSSLCSAL